MLVPPPAGKPQLKQRKLFYKRFLCTSAVPRTSLYRRQVTEKICLADHSNADTYQEVDGDRQEDREEDGGSEHDDREENRGNGREDREENGRIGQDDRQEDNGTGQVDREEDEQDQIKIQDSLQIILAEGIPGGSSSSESTPQDTSAFIKYSDGTICLVEPHSPQQTL
ncbi:ribosome biogenesis protein ERB1-like [Mugil cephalus]|uniref:ribosome biogenesis protein ERB1-like n=1 Tax=Mugil cephalus TaxID=48193 RepID=UPI001FB6BB74|nr:ribosome biogenesis protein ERB1-like [Mugil cephalus]